MSNSLYFTSMIIKKLKGLHSPGLHFHKMYLAGLLTYPKPNRLPASTAVTC